MKAVLIQPITKILIALVVLTVMLVGTSFATLLASSAYAASVTHVAPKRTNGCVSGHPCVTIFATDVNVRAIESANNCVDFPSRACRVIDHLAGGGEKVEAFCQQRGERITDGNNSSNYWTSMDGDNGNGGWVSNVFIVGGAKISGVPDCPQ